MNAFYLPFGDNFPALTTVYLGRDFTYHWLDFVHKGILYLLKHMSFLEVGHSTRWIIDITCNGNSYFFCARNSVVVVELAKREENLGREWHNLDTKICKQLDS